MGASENKVVQATPRPSSTAGEPSAKVAGEETRADIVPLFGEEDTFVERLISENDSDNDNDNDNDRASTEPIWFDEVLAESDFELVETRRELRRARSEITAARCDVAQERARVDGLKNALELAIARTRVLEARCAAEIERATHAEDRACALAAQLADQADSHESSVEELERQGAAAVAAAYLWFARLHR